MSKFLPALVAREERREGGLVARVGAVDRQTDIGLARIEHAAELQVGLLRAAGYVGSRAMQEVALVSQMEANLSALVPMAIGRLQAIGGMVILEAVDVVPETVRRVARWSR